MVLDSNQPWSLTIVGCELVFKIVWALRLDICQLVDWKPQIKSWTNLVGWR